MKKDASAGPAMTRRSIFEIGASAAALALSTGLRARNTATARLPNDLVMLDATTLAQNIRARRVSCTEVMTAFLDHIERHNPAVNAIVALQPRKDLLAQANERDAQAQRGEWRGPMHGFPHAVKDLQPVRGIVSTSGSPIFRGFVPTDDSIMVGRLRRAGAIIIGKTNTPEFGLGSHTYNTVYGTTLNPYERTRSAGGSSGGAAAALALRMLPLADGSDFGGSLRNPAAWNNVLGFRPSFGRVPVAGDDVWIPGMSVNGPMARTIPDLAMLLSVQAGRDDRAPLSMETKSFELGSLLSADLKGKRIGWLGDFGGVTPCEAGVIDICKEALKTFEALGCNVEDVLPDIALPPVWRGLLKLRGWHAGGGLLELYNDPVKRRQMKPEAIFEVESGLKLSAFDVRAASVVRTNWFNSISRLFARFDYLVGPAAQVFPFDAKLDWPHAIGDVRMETYHEWQKGNFLITMTGCPALAVPAGFSAQGLPIGLQIVAPVNHDLACFQLGHAYHMSSDWTHKRLPPAIA